MKIVFVTTQSPLQSTLIGRVMPLAQEFQKMGNAVTVLVHEENVATPSRLPAGQAGSPLYKGEKSQPKLKIIGPNPFERTAGGKKRYSGLRLIWTMKMNAIRAAWQLIKEKPDTVIIVKPLPENTLAVFLAKPFLKKTKIILDVDDFELEANQLTSLLQRAAIHASERAAVKMASHIIVATPFLGDHMQLLTGSKIPVTLIPTGLPLIPLSLDGERDGVRGILVSPAGTARHTMLFAGSVSISSGHRVDMLPEILVQVRKRVPDATLIIAGTGDDETALREQFAKLGLQDATTWHGRFSLDNIGPLMQDSAVLIDPIDASIANRAKSSFRAALALAYGVPIVSSNIGIRTAMIPATLHARFFAKPGDATAYAEKIITLLQAPVSEKDSALLQDASTQYQYNYLAQVYYNCIV